jgi:hypothetical protein
MLESISWIFTIVALYGTYLNTHRDIRGFYFWLVSNSAFCVINFANNMLAQGFLFGVYTILALIGIKNWKE